MALSRAHPGVIRWRGALWLVHPDFADTKKLKLPARPGARSGPGAYVVVIAVFAVVVALNVWLPYSVKQRLTGWVPAADVESGFTASASVVAIVILGVIAWFAYRKPDVAELGSDRMVSAEIFESVGVSVSDEMSWKKLWNLGSPLARLEESSFAAFEATERGDHPAAEKNREIVRTELHRAERAATALGLEPDLSFYRSSGE